MTFQTIAGSAPLRIVIAGAGSMGQAWIRNVQDSACAELVGVADVMDGVAQNAVASLGEAGAGISTGADAVLLARQLSADALINVTIPEAHHPVTVAALGAGMPVLGEKPAAATLAEALSLAAHAQVTGQLFMVSQSRRYNAHVEALRIGHQQLGGPAVVSTQFFKAPHFGGFRDAMEYPLIIDMAIHPFDTVRKILGADPVWVRVESFNPPWSWYQGDANVTATFGMSDGSRFTYTGSWCQGGAETSWNAEWRIGTERGSLLWDGDNAPSGELTDGTTVELPDFTSGYAPEIAGSLAEFCASLRSGETPQGIIADNVYSLAMVEAAVASARTDARVMIADLLESARAQALAAEDREDVRAALDALTFLSV